MSVQILINELRNKFDGANFSIGGTHSDIVQMFDENLFVGIVQTRISFMEMAVKGIYVKKACQRKGIGSRYMDALVCACKKIGISYIVCRPVSDSSGALNGHAFWKKMGFLSTQTPGIWKKCV